MMETYDNLLTHPPPSGITTTTGSTPQLVATNLSSDTSTSTTTATTPIDWRTSGPFGNVSLLPWDVVADTFLKQLNGHAESTQHNGSHSSRNGSGLSGSGVSAIRQLPFAAYQSVAAISTQATGTAADEQQFYDAGGGGGGGVVGVDGTESFVSWASTPTTPSQVFFIVKVVIMCFIIVSAVFGNLLVIVSVMRHRKLR